MKIFPLNLTEPTDKLKQLISEHPDYPIVVLVSESANTGDYSWQYSSLISFGIEEMLDCETPYDDVVYTDRDEFGEQFADWLWYEMHDDNPKLTEEEFHAALKKELASYEPYWKKVIAIRADN